MKFASLSLALLLVVSSAMAVAPVDNPVATMYGDSQYQWANQIKWNRTFNIMDYGGDNTGTNDNVAAFNAARDAAYAAGGGVVYCPTGTYKFTDSIYLKSGVVVRGDDPTGVTDAKTNGYAPPTKFTFPQYVPSFTGSGTANSTAFKQIGLVDQSKADNVGVVNVDVNRAELRFGVTGTGAWQYNGSTWLYPSLTARVNNVVVFGVRNNNVAAPSPYAPASWQNQWQRFSDPSVANINVQPWKNALVANNRINDAVTDSYFQPGYKVKRSGVTTTLNGTTYGDTPFAEFSYTDHYGLFVGRVGGGHSTGAAYTPLEDPAQFRTGIAVNDNYDYGTMRVKLYAGGLGAEIKNNVLRDKATKMIYIDAFSGQNWQTNNSATYENRTIDFCGYDVTVSGNNGETYRHRIASGPYYSVDGEGILMQQWATTPAVGEKIINNTVNSYIGFWFMGEMRDVLVEGNTVNNSFSIYVDSCNNDPHYATNNRPMYNVIVRNNTVTGSIHVVDQQYNSGTDGNLVTGNTGASLEYSSGVQLGTNTISGSTTMTTTATQVNRTPDVAITSPTMWASAGGTAVTVTASASDVDGTISKVDFYTQGTTDTQRAILLSSDTNGGDGWSCNYSGLTYGEDYMLTAKAYDNSGNNWTSRPVYFTAILAGDINKDRYCDVVDLGLLATSYGATIGGQWNMGDFNGDGKIDVIDLGILATNYGHTASGADAGMIPEPLTLSLLGVGVVGLLRRK